MGYPVMGWTARDGGSKTASWAGIATNINKMAGGPFGGNRKLAITTGGKAFASISDVFRLYEIEMAGIRWSKSAAWRTFFASLYGWWEHALAGGQFSFAYDSAKVGNTTIGATAHNDTVIDGIASTAAFAAGEWVYFEDATDPTKFARGRINTVDSGTQVTLYDQIGRVFSASSIMRAYEYLPTCVCLEDEFPLVEREGGKGVDTWDLKMRIRSVR